MSGFQSSLGDDDGIAEELAEGQRAISIAEFFEKNKHMLGFDSGARGLVTAIKEAVDNSLDATEEAGILPDIYVEIAEVGDYYKVIVEDNGPGITKEQLPKVFGKLLYGSRFHKREQSLTPDQKLLIRRDGETDLVSIGELCDTYLPDEGAATRPIDDHIEAPAFGRTNHQMNWEPVTQAIRHETAAETHLITTELDRTVEVTGNHSVFSISETGETVEVDAGDLTPGDEIMIPERLPRAGDPVTEINVLNRLDADSLEKSSVVVEGFTEDTRASLSEVTNSRESGIPAEAVIHHGYEQKAAAEGCSLRCDSTGGSDQQRESVRENNPVTEQHGQMTLPVQFETTAPFARLLGRFIATGEVTVGGLTALRQLHPSENKSNSAAVTDGGVALANTLSVRNKGVDNIATIVTTLVESLCEQSGDRRVPEFLFQAPATQQRAFLGGLHGAESPLHTAQSKLTFATDSATLRSQISVLWSMCGVSAASPDKSSDDGVEHQILVDSSQIRDPAAESSQEASNTAQTTAVEETSDLLAGTDMQLLEVESVEQTDPPEYVYDISVPGASGHDENFVVANDGPISVKNSRGQQGIGISAAVLYSQLTSGKPAKITSRPKGADTAQYFELIIDTDTNEPEIKADTETSWDRPHGTRIELEMEANMRARQQLHDYIQHTAVVNPHARVELREPKLAEPLKFERATDQLPDETHEIRPHPHGVELGTLIKMLESSDSYSLSGFLQTEFTRVGTKTADSVSDAFRDRHYGRELSWPSPAKDESVDIVGAVKEAVSNKGATATTEFAESVATAVSERNRVAHHQVIEIIQNAADEIAAKHDRTFGKTVRNNAVDAAWGQISAFGENDTDGDDETAAKPDRITPDVYTTVDSATGQRKDDATVTALSEAIARRLINRGGEKGRLTDEQLSRVVSDAAEFVIEQRDATIGETAQENIREALDEMMVTVPDDPPKITDIAANRNTANDLLDAMQATDILSPPTDCLAPITADLVDAGLRKEFDADFFAAATRDADVHGGDPFIVEAGIAYGGEIESGSVDVMRFANRVPLVYQRGACATTDVIKRIGWRNYGLDQSGGSGIPSGNAVIMIHVASTNVPFTSESKDAIANVPEMEDEIELAIREASRDLKSYLNKRRSLEKRREKQDVLGRILPEMADKVSEVTERNRPTIDGAMARIMNNLTVQREHEDDEVSISIHNYSDATETPEITEILETEPVDLSDGASAVEMDDEWFVSWEPSVSAGDTAELTYSVSGDPDSELMIDGVDQEKLTIDT